MFYISYVVVMFFFFQAEDGIRDLVRSRGLGDVYKRQVIKVFTTEYRTYELVCPACNKVHKTEFPEDVKQPCLLYTSDAADDLLCVDIGGRRIIKKKKYIPHKITRHNTIIIEFNTTHISHHTD